MAAPGLTMQQLADANASAGLNRLGFEVTAAGAGNAEIVMT